MRFGVFAILLSACTSSAVPISTPDAMTVVWENVYLMEMATRPLVVWHDECRTVDHGGDRVLNAKYGCMASIVNGDGTIEMQSATRISQSGFTIALAEWKAKLLTSEFLPFNGAEVSKANVALTDAGL